MPTTFVLNPGGNTTFTNELRKIDVFSGALTIHKGTEDPVVVKAGETYDAHNNAPTDVYAPDGANYAVTHSSESVSPETVAGQPVLGAINVKRKRTTRKPSPTKK